MMASDTRYTDTDYADNGFRLTGRHILFAMLAFFGLVIAVNIVFVNLALGTFTGLTDQDSYRTGVSWNRQLERAEEMRALGWSVTVVADVSRVFEKAGDNRRAVSLTVSIDDSHGNRLDRVGLQGVARHPIAQASDQPVSFVAGPGGTYAADVVLEGPGNWTLRLVTSAPDGGTFRIDRPLRIR